jgi:hypothetical protein
MRLGQLDNLYVYNLFHRFDIYISNKWIIFPLNRSWKGNVPACNLLV